MLEMTKHVKKLLDGLLCKINKAQEMVNALREMGHDIDDDYIVDLKFFDED